MNSINGKKSKLSDYEWKLVRTKKFKDWFGDWELAYKNKNWTNVSQIIDLETFEPIVCFHYSPNKFQKFKRAYPSNKATVFNDAYYFISKNNGNFYGDYLYRCFLKMRKGKIFFIDISKTDFTTLEFQQNLWSIKRGEDPENYDGMQHLTDNFETKYDGFVIKNPEYGNQGDIEYMVFKSKNIFIARRGII